MMKLQVIQGENSLTYNEETMKRILTWWLNENQFGKAVAQPVEVIDIEQSRHDVSTAGKKKELKKFYEVKFKPQEKE